MNYKMSRPIKSEQDKKVRVNITLSKSVYKNLKSKGINISGTINKLLKAMYFNTSELSFVENKNSPARIRTAVHASKGHDD